MVDVENHLGCVGDVITVDYVVKSGVRNVAALRPLLKLVSVTVCYGSV